MVYSGANAFKRGVSQAWITPKTLPVHLCSRGTLGCTVSALFLLYSC